MAFQDIIIFRNTAGAVINLETFQDMTIFTVLKCAIQAPDGAISTVNCTINSIANTQIEFTTGSSTFNTAGIYKLQSLADGIRGETAVINVKELFE